MTGSCDRGVRRLEVGDASVAYLDRGSGPVLVFVHGYFLSSRTWRRVIPALEPTHRCIAVDLLGAGETEQTEDADLSPASQVRMLCGLLDALEVPSATLVAHDSGAVLTRQLALELPGRVAGLVLSDTELPHCPVASAHAAAGLLRVPGAPAAFAALLGSRLVWRHLLARASLHAPSRVDLDAIVDTHWSLLRESRQRRRASARFARQWDLELVDRLDHGRLEMPKLVLWGERDRFIPLSRVRRFFDDLPDPKQLVLLPDCGTLPHEEQPTAWLDAVRSFLSGTEGARPETVRTASS